MHRKINKSTHTQICIHIHIHTYIVHLLPSQPRRYPEGSSEEQLAQYVARLERIRGVRRAEPLHRLDMAVVLCHAGADEEFWGPAAVERWEKPGKK